MQKSIKRGNICYDLHTNSFMKLEKWHRETNPLPGIMSYLINH